MEGTLFLLEGTLVKRARGLGWAYAYMYLYLHLPQAAQGRTSEEVAEELTIPACLCAGVV